MPWEIKEKHMRNISEYLSKHLESEKPVGDRPEFLLRPLVENITFQDGYGEIEAERRGVKLNIVYGPSNSHEAMDVAMGSLAVLDKSRAIKKGWKVLEKLTIVDEKGLEIINLNELLRSQTAPSSFSQHERRITIVFSATNAPDTQESKMGLERSLDGDHASILIENNITSPSTLLAMFHEVGHYKRSLNKDLYKYLTFARTLNKKLLTKEDISDPDLNEKIAEMVLREERGAWAYVLKTIKPLIRSGFFNKEEVLSFIHERSLQTYSNFFRSFIDPGLKDKVLMSIRSFINTFFNNTEAK